MNTYCCKGGEISVAYFAIVREEMGEDHLVDDTV